MHENLDVDHYRYLYHRPADRHRRPQTDFLKHCTVKYDDVSWHAGGQFPADLPAAAGATHIAMFVAWCVLHDLAGELHADVLAPLRARTLTPGQWFLQACDGKFTDENVNDDGNDFTAAYFEAEDMTYVADYQETLALDLDSLYRVPDTWASYDALAPVIDARFAAWQAAR